jgi:hypothetical protein
LSWLSRTVDRMETSTTTIDWSHELVEQLDWHWQNHVRPRFEGLSDEEYLWEPVPGCWSVRRRDDARSPMAAGAGDTVADFEYPEPDPVPFTTIAWRMAHLSIGVFGTRAANHFGVAGSVEYDSTDFPLDAAGGLALLDRHYAAWISGVSALGNDGLDRQCGPAEGPFAEYSMAALVLHISREAIHHGSEVCLLRDLYRADYDGSGDPR